MLGPDLGDVVLADPPLAAVSLQDERQVHRDLPTLGVAEGDVGEATGCLLADRVGDEVRKIVDDLLAEAELNDPESSAPEAATGRGGAGFDEHSRRRSEYRWHGGDC
jgi:hypothetical protein